jgi:hypothetical protein
MFGKRKYPRIIVAGPDPKTLRTYQAVLDGPQIKVYKIGRIKAASHPVHNIPADSVSYFLYDGELTYVVGLSPEVIEMDKRMQEWYGMLALGAMEYKTGNIITAIVPYASLLSFVLVLVMLVQLFAFSNNFSGVVASTNAGIQQITVMLSKDVKK